MTSKNVKLDGYLVIWTKKIRPEYIIKKDTQLVICAETTDGGDYRLKHDDHKYLTIDYPVFRFRKDAVRYVCGNKDFEIVKCKLNFTDPY